MSLHFNSQNKKTKVFVFLSILTFPIISSSTFDAPINFKSNEIVTHGEFSADLWAAVPAPCVTISLDLKFIGASKVDDEIIGQVKILKKTKTLVFLFCELKCNNKIITSASGVWKILAKR